MFVLGLVIVVVSVVGMVAPSVLLRVASRFDHSAAWYRMAVADAAAGRGVCSASGWSRGTCDADCRGGSSSGGYRRVVASG